MKRYRKSVCKGNFLHKFKEVKQTSTGLLERCEICGLQIHFPMNAPNIYYLQYHIRSILRASDPLFNREYNKK